MPLLEEVAARLVAQGVGTLSSNIFYGSNAVIPTGDGPYLTLTETGGMAPMRIQNKASGNIQQPTFQVAVRARTYPVARAMCKAAYDALDGVFNLTLSGTFYQKITARQEPTDIGLDGVKRPTVVVNFEVMKNPS